MSTGAPLMVEQFHFIHQKLKKVQIASICGGTDIIGCFMLGNPNLPVVRRRNSMPWIRNATDSVDGDGSSVRNRKENSFVAKHFQVDLLDF